MNTLSTISSISNGHSPAGASLPPDPPRKRARKIKGALGPFQTNATTFEKGKDRAIEIAAITPAAIVYRIKGRQDTYILPHSIGLMKALATAANVNIDPRAGRVRRGVQL